MSTSITTPQRHHLDRHADKLAASIITGSPDDLLSTPGAAALLRVSTQFLEIARSKNYGPKFIRLGPRCIRYRRDDLLAWLRDRTHASTAEYDGHPGPGRPRKAQVVTERRVLPKRGVTP